MVAEGRGLRQKVVRGRVVGEVVRHGREEGEVLEGEEGQHGSHAVRLHRAKQISATVNIF